MRNQLLTVSDFFHDEGVEANLINALIQTVGYIELLHLLVQHELLRISQFWTQDLVIELLCEMRNKIVH